MEENNNKSFLAVSHDVNPAQRCKRKLANIPGKLQNRSYTRTFSLAPPTRHKIQVWSNTPPLTHTHTDEWTNAHEEKCRLLRDLDVGLVTWFRHRLAIVFFSGNVFLTREAKSNTRQIFFPHHRPKVAEGNMAELVNWYSHLPQGTNLFMALHPTTSW